MAYYMTIRDRKLIEEAVNKGMSIRAVAKLIGKSAMAVDIELMIRNKDGVYGVFGLRLTDQLRDG